MSNEYTYQIQLAGTLPTLDQRWNSPAWKDAQTAEVAHFRPESSSHRPRTQVRLLYAGGGIHGIYQVQDRFVRSVRTQYMEEVWKDACVEVFLQPRPDRGYFNFEMNCGGALVSNYITDPTRTPKGGLTEAKPLPLDLAKTIQVQSSMPRVVEPEIAEPITWELCFFIPFAVFETYVGPLGTISGQQWRGNFFKCAEDNSHPHWASWSPVDQFNFHLPRCFGTIVFI